MLPSPASLLRTPRVATLCLIIGTVCWGLGAVAFVLSRNFFDPVIFGRRAADSLSDPGVAAYAADLITSRVVHRKPDLIAFRPMLLAAARTVVSSKPFRSVVEQAARQSSSGGVQRGRPARPAFSSRPQCPGARCAEKRKSCPGCQGSEIARFHGRQARGRQNCFADSQARPRGSGDSDGSGSLFFVVALGFHILALWLAADRQRALTRAGVGLIVTGLVLAGLVAMNPLARTLGPAARELGLVRGLWRAYLGDLTRWGIFFVGHRRSCCFRRLFAPRAHRPVRATRQYRARPGLSP